MLDGEIVIIRPSGFDFEALLARLHPAASRIARLRGETPASLIAFDALAAICSGRCSIGAARCSTPAT